MSGTEFGLTLKKLKIKKIPLSLDTRKSLIMEKGIKFKIKLINDISGLKFDDQIQLNIIEKTQDTICNTSYSR